MKYKKENKWIAYVGLIIMFFSVWVGSFLVKYFVSVEYKFAAGFTFLILFILGLSFLIGYDE